MKKSLQLTILILIATVMFAGVMALSRPISLAKSLPKAQTVMHLVQNTLPPLAPTITPNPTPFPFVVAFDDQIQNHILHPAPLPGLVKFSQPPKGALALSTKNILTTTPSPQQGFDPVWPVEGAYRVSVLDYYTNGTPHGAYHDFVGMDIDHGGKTQDNDRRNILAVENGTVIKIVSDCTHEYPKTVSCGCNQGYGNEVQILHDNGVISVYMHFQTGSITAHLGDRVMRGQSIGKMGNTGLAYGTTGIHLHFELMTKDEGIYPLETYLSNQLYQKKITIDAACILPQSHYFMMIQQDYLPRGNAYIHK